MKAAIYKNGSMHLTVMPSPDLNGRKGAIIKTLGCGLCGSDIVKIKKKLVPDGTVLGHEVIGVIEEISSDVETSLLQGDKIAAAHHAPCFKCHYCLQKSYSQCDTFKNSNLIPGGFAEKIFLSDWHLKHTVLKVPQNVSNLNASLMEPLGCILRALDRADIQPRQNVLVVGLGFIGLLFVQVLKDFNIYVVGCDVLDDRLSIARALGTNFTFNSTDIDSSIDIINNHINFNGADVVILASGANASIELAMKAVRDGGKILVFASVPDENAAFVNNQVYYRELSIIAAYSSAPEFLLAAMNLISCGKIDLDRYSTTMKIEQINEAVNKAINHEAIKVYLEL